DAFLTFNEKDILQHQGKVSHDVAVALAYQEYEKYKALEDKRYISDFDKVIAKLEGKHE
ncbi:MAG: virulence RhuM family protein, partial [Candidatus Lindowbacteria bacterium]|nr:virulence RhuM family protein [Candidatus Lindowbacteria bacterium]